MGRRADLYAPLVIMVTHEGQEMVVIQQTTAKEKERVLVGELHARLCLLQHAHASVGETASRVYKDNTRAAR